MGLVVNIWLTTMTKYYWTIWKGNEGKTAGTKGRHHNWKPYTAIYIFFVCFLIIYLLRGEWVLFCICVWTEEWVRDCGNGCCLFDLVLNGCFSLRSLCLTCLLLWPLLVVFYCLGQLSRCCILLTFYVYFTLTSWLEHFLFPLSTHASDDSVSTGTDPKACPKTASTIIIDIGFLETSVFNSFSHFLVDYHQFLVTCNTSQAKS